MAARKQIDWDRIEIEYRANKLSVREIAKQHNISDKAIRNKAKSENWHKDLAKKIQVRTKDKLVRSLVRTLNASDEQVIEEIADRSAAVVESHRKDILAGRDISSMLMGELQHNTAHIEELEQAIDQAADEEKWSYQRRAMIDKAVSLPQRAAVLRDLATSMKTLQGLERTAFGIDGKESDEGSYEERLRALLTDE